MHITMCIPAAVPVDICLRVEPFPRRQIFCQCQRSKSFWDCSYERAINGYETWLLYYFERHYPQSYVFVEFSGSRKKTLAHCSRIVFFSQFGPWTQSIQRSRKKSYLSPVWNPCTHLYLTVQANYVMYATWEAVLVLISLIGKNIGIYIRKVDIHKHFCDTF